MFSLEPTAGGPDYGGDTVRAARNGGVGRARLRRLGRAAQSRSHEDVPGRLAAAHPRRSVLSRGARLTEATVAAFVAAELVGLRDPPPLIAALTALLVVEATLASTLVSGLQRVLSVVAGVALAVVLASIVGLTWWSLGALVAASIVVGQLLRLGPHLLEVPISAMLVLGVGHAAGAESVASGRIMETVVGAIAGVLVNVAFPPPVATRDASRAVTAFAKEIAALLSAAAEALEGGPIPGDLAAQWLEDARRLTRHAPRLDRALAHAERQTTPCGRCDTPAGRLRSSLEALEHTSISVRTLFRAMHDATQRRTGAQDDPDYAMHVRCSAAVLMADMARVLWAFGRCAHRRAGARPSSNTSSWPARWHPCDAAATGSKTYSSGTRAPAGTVGTQLRTAHHRRPDAAGARRRHDHRRPRPAAHEAGARQAARGRPRRHPPTRLARRIRPRTARIDRMP